MTFGGFAIGVFFAKVTFPPFKAAKELRPLLLGPLDMGILGAAFFAATLDQPSPPEVSDSRRCTLRELSVQHS